MIAEIAGWMAGRIESHAKLVLSAQQFVRMVPDRPLGRPGEATPQPRRLRQRKMGQVET